MTSRALSFVNAIGCLALTAVVVAQWRKERVLEGVLTAARAELVSAREQAATDAQRRAALERDIGVLKEALEATQQAAESTAAKLSEQDRLSIRLQAELGAARDQVSTWESALKARDERIRSLNADLAATRKRLEEAIARLKAGRGG